MDKTPIYGFNRPTFSNEPNIGQLTENADLTELVLNNHEQGENPHPKAYYTKTEVDTKITESDTTLTGSINGVKWNGKDDISITAPANGGHADTANHANTATQATNAGNANTVGGYGVPDNQNDTRGKIVLHLVNGVVEIGEYLDFHETFTEDFSVRITSQQKNLVVTPAPQGGGGLKNITASTAPPSGGVVGDVWLQYN